MVKAALKILPLILGVALLLGISSVSASCSYVGVTPGSQYDYNFSYQIRSASSSNTYSCTYRVVIKNVTDENPCVVGLLMRVTSGNISLIPYSIGFPTDSEEMVIPVLNMTTILIPTLIISPLVTNKTYVVPGLIMTWDDKGMLLKYVQTSELHGTTTVISMSQENSIPGYETPLTLLAIGIGLIGVIIIMAKKRNQSS